MVPLNSVLRNTGNVQGTFAARLTLWIYTCIYFSPYAITYFTNVAFLRDQDKIMLQQYRKKKIYDLGAGLGMGRAELSVLTKLSALVVKQS